MYMYKCIYTCIVHFKVHISYYIYLFKIFNMFSTQKSRIFYVICNKSVVTPYKKKKKHSDLISETENCIYILLKKKKRKRRCKCTFEFDHTIWV